MAGETILLIHGMWITPHSWEPWVDRYTRAGHRAVAEGWPGIDRAPAGIRRDPSALRGLGHEESDQIYDEQYIPGTNRSFFEAAYAALNRNSPAGVTFDNPKRAPLLLVVGELDHISPPALNKKLLKLQGRAASATDSRQYEGRTHYMAGMDGWEQIADDALEWAVAHARTT